MAEKKNVIELGLEVKGIDETLEKVEKYLNLLKEARTLADELASVEFNVDVKN